MDLDNKHIMFACCYEAEYGGNFLKMLTALADALQQKFCAKAYFVFPAQKPKEWLRELQRHYEVGFTCKPYSKSANDLLNLLTKWKIDLVHTHFEGYDIPVAKAIRKSGLDVKMAWHLHDNISFDKTGLNFKLLRKIGTNLRLWLQYGWYGRKAYFIGVSPEVANIATHYRNHILSFPQSKSNEILSVSKYPRASVVLNGIDMSRLSGSYNPHGDVFSFLTFGGESYGKGIPCILDAARQLCSEGLRFRLILTCGYTTREVLRGMLHGDMPQWLEVVGQTEKVTALFDMANCYISASLKETMSMAIAEASIYGLPVIQSDIPGTYWNAGNESTFLFKVNDVNGLASQMRHVMSMNSEELAAMCRKTAVKNKELLAMDKWVASVLDVYKSI